MWTRHAPRPIAAVVALLYLLLLLALLPLLWVGAAAVGSAQAARDFRRGPKGRLMRRLPSCTSLVPTPLTIGYTRLHSPCISTR